MTSRIGQVRRDAAVTLVALAALLAWEVSGLDRVVSGWFGNASGFVWRDAWLASGLLHEGGRKLAWALLALMASDAYRPFVAGPQRAERLRWLAVTVACLLFVPALKLASTTSCPWHLQSFGGLAMYVPHWRLHQPDGGPGHCFPSGHATAAFAFLSGYFLWRGERPDVGRRWLVAVGVAGMLFGGTQVVRGAHFPSHVFWSAWLCWVVCCVADACSARRLHCKAFSHGGRRIKAGAERQ